MRSALAAILLLCVPFLAHAQEREALAIVEKAVQAHGGVAGIKRLRVARVTYALKGDFSSLGVPGDADVMVEETYQLPRQIKKVIKGSAGSWHGALAWAIDGDTWWDQQILDGSPGPVTIHEQKNSDLEGMYRPYMVIETLANYQNLRWSMVSGEGQHAQPAAVLAKSDLTGAEITFRFSNETGLLNGIATRRAVAPTNKVVFHEEKCDAYQRFDGLQLPTTLLTYHDGKKIAEIHVTGVRFFEKIDDAEFAPPNTGFWHLASAALLGLGCCCVGGWSLGKLQGRRNLPAIRLAFTSAIAWGFGGFLIGLMLRHGLQWFRFSAALPPPVAAGLWMAFLGAFAGGVGGWLSGPKLPVSGDSSQGNLTALEQPPESIAERLSKPSLNSEGGDRMH